MATEVSTTAELFVDAAHGSLVLSPNGAFQQLANDLGCYTSYERFDGPAWEAARAR